MKTGLVHQACYPTRDAARRGLFAYIEGYYNRQRLYSALGHITPEQADRQAAQSGVHQIAGRSTWRITPWVEKWRRRTPPRYAAILPCRHQIPCIARSTFKSPSLLRFATRMAAFNSPPKMKMEAIM
jgi:Integrase core domain